MVAPKIFNYFVEFLVSNMNSFGTNIMMVFKMVSSMENFLRLKHTYFV